MYNLTEKPLHIFISEGYICYMCMLTVQAPLITDEKWFHWVTRKLKEIYKVIFTTICFDYPFKIINYQSIQIIIMAIWLLFVYQLTILLNQVPGFPDAKIFCSLCQTVTGKLLELIVLKSVLEPFSNALTSISQAFILSEYRDLQCSGIVNICYRKNYTACFLIFIFLFSLYNSSEELIRYFVFLWLRKF